MKIGCKIWFTTITEVNIILLILIIAQRQYFCFTSIFLFAAAYITTLPVLGILFLTTFYINYKLAIPTVKKINTIFILVCLVWCIPYGFVLSSIFSYGILISNFWQAINFLRAIIITTFLFLMSWSSILINQKNIIKYFNTESVVRILGYYIFLIPF